MKEVKQIYKITITISCFGNLEKFYKTFAKGNKEIVLENIEFKGQPDQHNTGFMKDTIICSAHNLKKEVKKFIDKNSLKGEFFYVTKKGSKKVLLTEEDL